MTDDPAPGFRAELNAALDVLAPEMQGLEDLAQAGLSPDITVAIENALNARRVRRGLILDVINALNVVLEKVAILNADDYPALPQVSISAILAEELEKERQALEAALAIFEGQLRASKIEVSLGEATSKS